MRPTLTILTIACLFLGAAASFGQQPATADNSGVASQQDPTTSPSAANATAGNPVVLRVNGDPIYAIEISMVMQTLQAQLSERGEQVDQRELAQVATQRAIEQKLLVQEARRFGAEADELEVARSAQMAEQQAGGRPALEAKLKASGSKYEQFLEIVRELELLRAFVEKQIKPNIEVTEEEIATYYRDNPEAFEAEDRAHAFHMIFVVGEDADPAVIAASRAKAEAARKRAMTGDEDFATVARDLSEGPSAPTGGDLGWVTRGALVSPLSETVFSLQPGDISEVVQSRFGFHVVTINDRRPAETISLEMASPQIEELLRAQRATDKMGQLIETLAGTAKVENLLGGSPGAPAVGTN